MVLKTMKPRFMRPADLVHGKRCILVKHGASLLCPHTVEGEPAPMELYFKDPDYIYEVLASWLNNHLWKVLPPMTSLRHWIVNCLLGRRNKLSHKSRVPPTPRLTWCPFFLTPGSTIPRAALGRAFDLVTLSLFQHGRTQFVLHGHAVVVLEFLILSSVHEWKLRG